MKVSVIVPTHNRGNLVIRAIESVLKQTYKEIEVIVVSDGSTDDTDELVNELCKKDDRVRYISYKPAKGGNVARNIGIKNAKYEYVAFLDDDDEWFENKLEKQMEIFKNYPEIGLVYTRCNIIYEQENISYLTKSSIEGNLRKDILFSNYIGTTSTVVTKKELINKCGGFDINLKALQDYDLWIRICQIADVAVVKEPCIKYYNLLKNNQISQQTDKYREAIEYISNKYKRLFDKMTPLEIKQINYNNCILIANKCLRNNDSKGARKQLIKALSYKFNIKIFIMYIFSFCKYKTILKLRSYI